MRVFVDLMKQTCFCAVSPLIGITDSSGNYVEKTITRSTKRHKIIIYLMTLIHNSYNFSFPFKAHL